MLGRNMAQALQRTRFDLIDLSDPFFESLKKQYGEFSDWFERKAAEKEPVYVIRKDDESLRGFIYLKVETGALTDVSPARPAAKRLKVGTLKIDARGTRLGERVIKKIFDHAIQEHVTEIYVTIFDTHSRLIALFEKYGFTTVATKTTPNGVEMVLVRELSRVSVDPRVGYPFVHTEGRRIWLLAVYPEYHSNLFPDSILTTETPDILSDVSHTNTIHKVYVAKLTLSRMSTGDIVVIYRTTDIPGRARFRSVATSVCIVEEVFSKKQFPDAEALITFAADHSIFTEEELRDWFSSSDRLYAIRMTYNIALPRRPNRAVLMDVVGISEQPRWDLREMTLEQFQEIMRLGRVDESFIVN